ncbi:CoB--CoM heterodisulfide reductase iron-sulfur subunit B family protein [Candidatus Chloroploca sp. M-50]|uniref:CoB--CoM heterodisulfide reductase iron-sulfur subunit B family protein n=1 Tax=Candidatus Chloroploca mongolica TaxID=2528176 RepID=A0ABS4DCU3_9CHLR|nr:CoB--CoM heterodisulfide reductase iron-sulfur subunit B family protein [Candidatus Chloroploca mongolica]MBP1467266.1 CoB--CoM heterodisulfide reductase iron-sulfur subunit B family protein [Candidatus Chloroploca mongolica]
MSIAYYPGCTIKVSAPEHELAALAVMRALGLDLHEMREWNCCGVVHSLATDNLIRHMAPVRVFARLQQQGEREVVTLCDMCFNTLARANQVARRQPEQMDAIKATSGDELNYDGSAEVLHLLQILRDRVGMAAIKARVRQPLHNLRVYPYYGCKLLRPTEVGLDDPEAPTVLGDLMAALGATVVEGNLQTRCCGAYHVVNRENLVAERVAATTAQARANGANVIVLSCPLCHFNLATRQSTPGNALPVLYYTQLMGLAFGLPPATLGLPDATALFEEALPTAQHAQAVPMCTKGER